MINFKGERRHDTPIEKLRNLMEERFLMGTKNKKNKKFQGKMHESYILGGMS